MNGYTGVYRTPFQSRDTIYNRPSVKRPPSAYSSNGGLEAYNKPGGGFTAQPSPPGFYRPPLIQPGVTDGGNVDIRPNVSPGQIPKNEYTMPSPNAPWLGNRPNNPYNTGFPQSNGNIMYQMSPNAGFSQNRPNYMNYGFGAPWGFYANPMQSLIRFGGGNGFSANPYIGNQWSYNNPRGIR